MCSVILSLMPVDGIAQASLSASGVICLVTNPHIKESPQNSQFVTNAEAVIGSAETGLAGHASPR